MKAIEFKIEAKHLVAITISLIVGVSILGFGYLNNKYKKETLLQKSVSEEQVRNYQKQQEIVVPTVNINQPEKQKYAMVYSSGLNATYKCLLEGVDAIKTADTNYKNSEIEYQNCLERKYNNYDRCSADCRSIVPMNLTTETAAGYAEISINCMKDCGQSLNEAGTLCEQRQSNSISGLLNLLQNYCNE